MKIAILGPPHSGKSCLSYSLRLALAKINGLPRPYVIDTTPDGEGSWFPKATRLSAALAAEHKAKKKRPFDWAWALRSAGWVKKCRLPLVIVDTGGIIDTKLAVICRHAGHAILVAPKDFDIEEWKSFMQGMELRLVAVVRSIPGEGADSFDRADKGKCPVLFVHGLERGHDRSDSPVIHWLAKRIARKIPQRHKDTTALHTTP